MATFTTKRRGKNVRVITWANLGVSDTGQAVEIPSFPDKTFKVQGVFGGATIVLEGSMDGAIWDTLFDTENVAMSFTSDSSNKVIRDNPLLIRAKTVGGVGTDATVTIVAVR